MTASVRDGDVGFSSTLADEVLRVSGLLAQEGAAKEGGQYVFQNEDEPVVEGAGTFELTRDDTLQLIGLLNSSEVEMAKRELGVLLGRLDRSAVEGLTRRFFVALRRRACELEALESEVKNPPRAPPRKGAVGVPPQMAAGPRGTLRQNPNRTRQAAAPVEQAELQHQLQYQQAYPQQDMLTPRLRQGAARSPAAEATAAPKAAPARARGRTRSPEAPPGGAMAKAEARPRLVGTDAVSPKSPRDDMPQVFRRLTAPSGGASLDEVARTRMALQSVGATAAPLSVGGIMTTDEGPQLSAYLEALLEAHEQEVGHPASSSRRQLSEERDPNTRRSPRVPEEKAKEIFDRLYKSGKEHRVRRRVYHELGLLVEQAKEAQTCTFEPRVPLASYPGGVQPEGSVTERLYREGVDRRRRREEAALNAPVPPFRPQTSTGGLQGTALISPRDTLPSSALSDAGAESEGRGQPPPHLRLFREHEERKARQVHRQDAYAEWRKHSFRPDISSSQASGPQITRAFSATGLPRQGDDAAGGMTPVLTTMGDRVLGTSYTAPVLATATGAHGAGPANGFNDSQGSADDVSYDGQDGIGYVDATPPREEYVQYQDQVLHMPPSLAQVKVPHASALEPEDHFLPHEGHLVSPEPEESVNISSFHEAPQSYVGGSTTPRGAPYVLEAPSPAPVTPPLGPHPAPGRYAPSAYHQAAPAASGSTQLHHGWPSEQLQPPSRDVSRQASVGSPVSSPPVPMRNFSGRIPNHTRTPSGGSAAIPTVATIVSHSPAGSPLLQPSPSGSQVPPVVTSWPQPPVLSHAGSMALVPPATPPGGGSVQPSPVASTTALMGRPVVSAPALGSLVGGPSLTVQPINQGGPSSPRVLGTPVASVPGRSPLPAGSPLMGGQQMQAAMPVPSPGVPRGSLPGQWPGVPVPSPGVPGGPPRGMAVAGPGSLTMPLSPRLSMQPGFVVAAPPGQWPQQLAPGQALQVLPGMPGMPAMQAMRPGAVPMQMPRY